MAGLTPPLAPPPRYQVLCFYKKAFKKTTTEFPGYLKIQFRSQHRGEKMFRWGGANGSKLPRTGGAKDTRGSLETSHFNRVTQRAELPGSVRDRRRA